MTGSLPWKGWESVLGLLKYLLAFTAD
ncbi:rCG19986 [Rattus norvegicus]|uniref:RCG19986 n=1 Tax=Rattus norvegicus TaxID=10116 RepID=A6KIE2_RAT|nr:rCG19986 [Rattus norvegicus]